MTDNKTAPTPEQITPDYLREVKMLHERFVVQVTPQGTGNRKIANEVSAALGAAADALEFVLFERDSVAEVAGIEPEWTEADL